MLRELITDLSKYCNYDGYSLQTGVDELPEGSRAILIRPVSDHPDERVRFKRTAYFLVTISAKGLTEHNLDLVYELDDVREYLCNVLYYELGYEIGICEHEYSDNGIQFALTQQVFKHKVNLFSQEKNKLEDIKLKNMYIEPVKGRKHR